MKLVPRAKFQPKTRDFKPDSFVQYRLEVKNHVFTISVPLSEGHISTSTNILISQNISLPKKVAY